MEYLAGVAAALLFWLVCSVISGFWNPLKLVEGHDGRASISKLQWFLWTAVIAFSYVAIYTAQARAGSPPPDGNLPYNLWVAMGLSSGTMIAAKGAAEADARKGRVVITKGTGAKPGELVKDDSGFPDFSKAQLLTWTFIAIGIYIASVVGEVRNGGNAVLPDIDPTLIVLMGLSQGGYLGKKLATRTAPRITGLSPGAGSAGASVRILGLQLGDSHAGSLITIDDNPIAMEGPGAVWKGTDVTFTLPPINLTGLSEKRVMIGVIVNGQESNALAFTVTAPAG